MVSATPIAPKEGNALTLVSEGKANCVIVTQADPKQGSGAYGERPLWQVVMDFQRILEKMTGAKLPIVLPVDAPIEGAKIYIGDVPLPPGLVLDDKELDPRGYWLVANPQALILRGKTEGGTINAIYGFLQDKLKVKWFFPSELFEVIPQQATVQMSFCREVHNPSFKGGMFSITSGINNEGALWCERMRRDAGAFRYQAPMVHYLGYILDSAKYGKTHPEFYPLINGQRLIPPPGRSDSGPQPCLSNPDLVKEVVEFGRNTFDANPNSLMVAIGEHDSTDWCACDPCRAMDTVPTEKMNGMEQHSDRYFTFANQVARAIAQTHPGKMVGCLAYNGTVTPPKKIAKLESNVAIGICIDDSQYYDANYKAGDYRNLSDWKTKCKNICFYDYLSLGWTAPRYYPHLYARHLKEMHKQGVLAMFTQPEPYWATFGPMIYMATQLMWDVNQNPDVILNDLFLMLFGKEAGAEMKAYYEVFENAWMRPSAVRTGKYFEGWSYMQEQMAVYTLQDLDKALKHLESARALAKDPVARQRVEYIDHSFSYAATVMRGWLVGNAIDAVVNSGDPKSQDQAVKLRDMLRVVAEIKKKEDAVYRATLLVDPISSQSYYKAGGSDSGHWEGVRGQWAPRCAYSLRTGATSLLKYYKDRNMTAETLLLESELPAEILKAARDAASETLGEECLVNGNMEGADLGGQWQAGNATLSISADAHGGKQSIKIDATADMGRLVQSFRVKPRARYKYDYWYKCSRPGEFYSFVQIDGEDRCATGELHYTSEWSRATGYFTTPKGGKLATIGFCGWPGKPNLIDDVSIREVLQSKQIACKKLVPNFPDWSHPTFVLNTADRLGTDTPPDIWRGPDQFSAIVCLGWQEEGLRLVVRVKDTDRVQASSGKDMWKGDSIQFGIDENGDAAKRGYGAGFDSTAGFLYGLSQLDKKDGKAELYCWNAPKGKLTGSIANDESGYHYSVKRDKDEVLYDVLIEWKQLGIIPKDGHVFSFNLVVFDCFRKASGSNELVWLQLTPGISGSEGLSPNLWRSIVLTTQD